MNVVLAATALGCALNAGALSAFCLAAAALLIVGVIQD